MISAQTGLTEDLGFIRFIHLSESICVYPNRLR